MSELKTSTQAEDYAAGMVNRRRVLGYAWIDKSIAKSNSFNTEFQQLITRYAWNEVWDRPAFGDKTCRLIVLSTMIALKAYEEFAMHVRAAHVEVVGLVQHQRVRHARARSAGRSRGLAPHA